LQLQSGLVDKRKAPETDYCHRRYNRFKKHTWLQSETEILEKAAALYYVGGKGGGGEGEKTKYFKGTAAKDLFHRNFAISNMSGNYSKQHSPFGF
jgi:hypothetical protein